MRFIFVFTSLLAALVLSANASENILNELLENAATSGNLDDVRRIVEGVKANCNNGMAMILAAQHNKLDVVRYLVDDAPEPRAEANSQKGAALWAASYHGSLEVVRYLLNEKSDKFTDEQLNLAIVAAKNDDIGLEIAKCLIGRGGVLNDKASLKIKCMDHLKTVGFLLNQRSDAFSDEQFDLAISAARNRYPVIMKLIEEH